MNILDTHLCTTILITMLEHIKGLKYGIKDRMVVGHLRLMNGETGIR
jgi:hypothetical protein